MALVTFDFWTANRYLKGGWWVRLVEWDGSEGGHVLAWVIYHRGLYYYKTAAVMRVVESLDVLYNDFLKETWTLQGPDDDDDFYVPPDDDLPPYEEPGGILPPDRGVKTPNLGRSKKAKSSVESGGGKTPSGESPGGSGGGGGSLPPGGSTPPPGPRWPKSQPQNPTVTVTATAGSCTNLADGEIESSSVTINISLGTTTDAPPGPWFYQVTVRHNGGSTLKNGSISLGGSTSLSVSVSVAVGTSYTVSVRCYKAGTYLSATGSDSYSIQHCSS